MQHENLIHPAGQASIESIWAAILELHYIPFCVVMKAQNMKGGKEMTGALQILQLLTPLSWLCCFSEKLGAKSVSALDLHIISSGKTDGSDKTNSGSVFAGNPRGWRAFSCAVDSSTER